MAFRHMLTRTHTYTQTDKHTQYTHILLSLSIMPKYAHSFVRHTHL